MTTDGNQQDYNGRSIYSLGIDISKLGLNESVDTYSIKNIYIDVDDTHIRVAPFESYGTVDLKGTIVNLPATSIGSVYEVQLLGAGKVIISAYFSMPEEDTFLSELQLFTAYPQPGKYPEGPQGERGANNYELAIESGFFTGSLEEWLEYEVRDSDLKSLREILRADPDDTVYIAGEPIELKPYSYYTNLIEGLSENVTNQASQSVQNAIEGVAIDANLVTDALVKTVPKSIGAIDRNQYSQNAESLTPYDFGALQNSTATVLDWYTVGSANYRGYADLAAVQADYPHVTAATDFIAWAALQAFFNAVTSGYDNTNYSVVGSFHLNKPIDVSGKGTRSLFRNGRVDADLVLFDKSGVGLEYMMSFGNGLENFVLNGKVEAWGVGSSTYSTRKTENIYKIKAGAKACYFGKLFGAYARKWCIYSENDTTSNIFGYVKASFCGTSNGTVSRVARTATSITNSGSSGSASQTSSVVLNSAIDSDFVGAQTFMFSQKTQQAYFVQSISEDFTTATVFPWVDPADVGTDFYFIQGGGFYIEGGDGSTVNIDYLDALQSGIGHWAASLYPPKVNHLLTQYCSIGLAIGKTYFTACASGSVGQWYCEANNLNLLKVTTSDKVSYAIDSTLGEFQTSKIAVFAPCYGTNYDLINSGTLQGVKFNNLLGSSIELSHGVLGINLYISAAAPKSDYVVNLDTAIINLSSNKKLSAQTNKYGFLIHAVGTGANSSPTQYTFNRASDWTINGLASNYVVGDFDRATSISVVADYTNKNWRIAALRDVQEEVVELKADSGFIDHGTIPANSQGQVSSVTLTGAKFGDNVVATFSKSLAGLSLHAYVSAADTVSYYFRNGTGAAVTVGAGRVYLTVK